MSKFMFWDLFSYNRKSLCHCWKTKTVKKKKVIIEYLNKLNKKLELTAKEK